MSLVKNFPHNGIVTVNRVILKDEYTLDDLQLRVAEMCENVKTYHSETGFIGGMVVLNSGQISNEGSHLGKALDSEIKDREALIITFRNSYDDHEISHKSEPFQPLFQFVGVRFVLMIRCAIFFWPFKFWPFKFHASLLLRRRRLHFLPYFRRR